MGIVAFRPAHPLAGLTLWHGTSAANLDSILHEGIRPTTSGQGRKHACLTLDPGCAVFFGHLDFVLDRAKGPADIALIAIPGESLDVETLCPEYGSLDISAFGQNLPGRSRAQLTEAEHDWKAFLDASSCLGVQGHIPVHAARVDTRFYGIDMSQRTMEVILSDMGAGALSCPDLNARLARAPQWLDTPMALAA